MAKMTDDEYEEAHELMEKFRKKVHAARAEFFDNNAKLTKAQVDYIYDYLHDNFRWSH